MKKLTLASLKLMYAFLPVIQNTGPRKLGLDLLVATDVGDEVGLQLALVQLFNWYATEQGQESCRVTLHIRADAAKLIALLCQAGVTHKTVDNQVDWTNSEAVAAIGRDLDADVILLAQQHDVEAFDDELFLATNNIADVLYAIEAHARGFDILWSFETPMKGLPWSNFYLMTHRAQFDPLMQAHERLAQKGDDVKEAFRVILYLSLPLLFFCRDRIAFYRQQQRSTRRKGYERQDFAFEYAAYLNLFYLTFYSAVDQVAVLANHYLALGLADDEVGATYKSFQKALRAKDAKVADLFSGKVFWAMFRMPRLARHQAAHRGPLMPTQVFIGDDNFTAIEIEAKANELGYFQGLDALPVGPLKDHAIAMALFKGKLALFEQKLEHALVLRDGKKMVFWYADPKTNLKQFLDFLNSVLGALPP